jgi:DNA invertase Pin-like site-specific DNA recombinase
MYFLHDHTQVHIARELGISQSTVSQHINGKKRNGKKIGGSIRKIRKAIRYMSLNVKENHGKSGLSTEGRDNFKRMLEMVIDTNIKFKYILVLDVSRWGRFQDIDMSAHYRALCKKYGREVVYTTIGFPKEDDPMHFMQLNFEGYRAATYSRELSGKVFRGCVKIAQQGFRAGAQVPYGLARLLLDEQHDPVQILKPGQRKSIQNQRVTLTPGDKEEQAVIKRIFREFAYNRKIPKKIAEQLNSEHIPSRSGGQWEGSSIVSILKNELYVGTMVYNRTASRLQARTRDNPRDMWIRTEDAFDPVVDKDIFYRAQKILERQEEEKRRLYSREDMLEKLNDLYQIYGVIRAKQIAARKNMVSVHSHTKKFNSLDMAYQNMFEDVLEQTRKTVITLLKSQAEDIEEYDDYIVLNNSFSILIQPSVPVPYGYSAYWSFRPDQRIEIDVTMGVPLSNNKKHDILGYLFFPRLMAQSKSIKIFSSSEGNLDLYGYQDFELIDRVLC